MTKKLLRIPEVSEATGWSRAFIYERLLAGEIPVVRLGRTVRVPAGAIDDWIKRNSETFSGEPWTGGAA